MNRLTHMTDRLADRIAWQFRPGAMIDRTLPRDDPQLERVYLDRGLILIHIPKNAGTSVEDAMFGYRVRHRTWGEIRDLCPEAWKILPKIAIIRDPVDRFLSAYDYLRAGGRNAADRAFARRMIGARSAAEIAAKLVAQPSYRRPALRYFHFRPQADYVCGDAGIMIDHLIPFPHMAEGLTRYAGVPPGALHHANRTAGQRTDRAALAPETLAHIEAVYTKDRAMYEAACAAWSTQSTNDTRLHSASGTER